MRKLLLLIGLIVLGISIFSLPPIIVEELNDGQELFVEFRLKKFTINEYGELKDFFIFEPQSRAFIQIYQYGEDSFDIFDINTNEKILPIDFDYRISFENEYLEIIYYYENNGIKRYKFYNNEFFNFEVTISNIIGEVSIPIISFPPGIRRLDNRLISFIEDLPGPGRGQKTDAVMAIDTSTPISADLRYNTSGVTTAYVYMGPFKRTLIREAFDENVYEDINFLLKDVGAYSVFSNIFYYFVEFLWFINKITGNFGWAIIVFTIIIRFVLYPLYHKQTKSMMSMRKLQPEMDIIKKKYKDRQKQQEEIMKLYKKHNMNPMGGCLPALVQLPVFIILWRTIQYFGESFAYNPRFLLWDDLSEGGFSKNFVLILMSLAAYVLHALLSAQNTKMAWQSIAMTMIFPLLLSNLPSGVFVYYTTNAIIQLAITFFNNKRHNIKSITIRELFGLGPKPIRR